MSSQSLFEILPDEIILHICQYLRGADILYSFYNLNSRLNTTITGFCRYVNLMAVPYEQFEYAVCRVLPQIGSLVQTFILNGNWETIMNSESHSILFCLQRSFLFPQLRKLTVKWFTSERFLLLIDILQNLPHLNELNIQFLKGDTTNLLLDKVLSANNGQLSIVLFDHDSIDLDIPNDTNRTSYPNIKELTINLTFSELLRPFFQLVPNICRLYLSINELSNEPKNISTFANLPPLVHLTVFQLRTMNLFWTFDEISDILKAMPFLQKLALDLRTDDKRLVSEDDFLTILPGSLVKVDFFIRYYFPKSNSETELSSFSSTSRFPVACLLDEPRHRFIIHTIPCHLNSVILTATISKQMVPGWKYMEQTEDLYIYDITSVTEILMILQHFRRLRILSIDAKDKAQILSLPSQSPSIHLKLPLLKQIEISGIFELFPLFNAASNVDYLIINFDCLKILVDDQATCQLLQTRIVRLNIVDWVDMKSDLLQHITQRFSSLRHLVISFTDSKLLIDEFVLKILSLWKGKPRRSLDVKGLLSQEASINLRQWVVTHSHMKMDDPFVVECNDDWFDMWF